MFSQFTKRFLILCSRMDMQLSQRRKSVLIITSLAALLAVLRTSWTHYSAMSVATMSVSRQFDVSNDCNHGRDLDSQPLLSKVTTQVKPIQHVVFCKIHKAASSTMHNILHRFALRNDLNVLMTYGVHINMNADVIPERKLVPIPDGSKYHILANHLIFNRQKISTFVPGDTVYVGIVREPFSQFVSALTYFSLVFPKPYLDRIITDNPDNPVEVFLNNSLDYMGPHKTEPNHVQINNRQSVDFGFPLTDFEASKTNVSKIKQFINKIDSEVDIILISELFDESLVLLRRMLNWETRDIVYLRNNVLKQKENVTVPAWTNKKRLDDYPAHTQSMFTQWAALDIALYNFFYAKFIDITKKQPEDFLEEVKAFKNVNKQVSEWCSGRVSGDKCRYFPPSLYTGGFELSWRECELMALPEKEMTNTSRRVQLERYKVFKEAT